MDELKRLQLSVQNYLLSGELPPLDISPLPQSLFHERIEIYRSAYYLRIAEHLQSDYPALYRALGRQGFASLVNRYLHRYPPTHFSLRQVGDRLSRFLREQEAPNLVWAELTEFEYALRQVLIAPESAALTLAKLAAIDPNDWPKLIFSPRPSVQLYHCYCPIAELYRSLVHDDSVIECQPQEILQHYLIWGELDSSYYQAISTPQTALFQALQARLSFVELCELMSSVAGAEEPITWISRTLQAWIADKIIADF